MAKSVGMFQRPVEYKVRKLGSAVSFYGVTAREDSQMIRIYSSKLDRTNLFVFIVHTFINSGYEYKFSVIFSFYSEHIDLDQRFYNAVKAAELLKKEILEEGKYVFHTMTYDDYTQAFKLIYPSVIDQVIASVKANEEVIKRSEIYEWSLL